MTITSATTAIEVNNCSKVFRVHKKDPGLKGSLRSLFRRHWEEKQALCDVSLQVHEGEILGLVGANGAGKTTLVKILSGIIHPTSGSASVMGMNPWDRKNEFRSKIALIMGQKAQLWWDLPAADCFLLLREIYRIPINDYNERLNYLSQTLQIQDLLTTQIRRLSLGERMKMELVAALLHNPKVVYLDEPTIGLDLTSQNAIRNFLLEYLEKHNPAMILTSHYMEDIKSLCKRIAIIKKGAIVYDGPLSHIIQEHINFKIIIVEMSSIQDAQSLTDKLPPDVGQVVSRNICTIRLQTQRQGIVKAVEYLLHNFHIADLSTEDEDISAIIESIQREK